MKRREGKRREDQRRAERAPRQGRNTSRGETRRETREGNTRRTNRRTDNKKEAIEGKETREGQRDEKSGIPHTLVDAPFSLFRIVPGSYYKSQLTANR